MKKGVYGLFKLLNISYKVKMNNEQKDKKEKIDFICFLVASIIFYIVSIINFIVKNTSTGVVFLCLGSAYLCLSSTHRNNDKNNKKS